CLRTIGIVKTEYRSLREDVGRAGTARIAIRIFSGKVERTVVGMVGIAFYFRGPSLVAAHENRRRSAKQRRGSREEKRFTGQVFLGLFDVGNDLFRRLINAAAQTGERE